MALKTLSPKRKAAIVEWLDTIDSILPAKTRTKLQEWVLDFAERELFAAIWTLVFVGIFGALSNPLLTLLFGETYATIGLLAFVGIALLMLFIFIFFPKSEVEEKLEELLERIPDDFVEDIAMIKRNV